MYLYDKVDLKNLFCMQMFLFKALNFLKNFAIRNIYIYFNVLMKILNYLLKIWVNRKYNSIKHPKRIDKL